MSEDLVFEPQEGSQEIAWNSDADVIIYGGSAGCVDKDTEFLTESGWVPFDQYREGMRVAEYSPKRDLISFKDPLEYICEVNRKGFIRVKTESLDMCLTPEHTVLYKTALDGNFLKSTLKDLLQKYISDGIADILIPCPDLSAGEIENITFESLKKSSVELKLSLDKKQYCLVTNTGYFLARRNGKIFITGNSGKSHLLLAHPLPYVDDPNFEGIFFRRVTRQLEGAGGLWPESKKLYKSYKTHVREQKLTHTFPSGATLAFAHMEHEKNRFDHQGLQYSAIFFDELTHFHESQFTYLLSRLRSSAGNKSYCMGSCNPDPDTWLMKWIRWWLDDKGDPIRERSGVKRYYVLVEDKPVFAATPEELIEAYPDQCKVYNPIDDTYVQITPKSFTFVSGTIFDNPILIKNNPSYLAELKSLPEVERARLLDGNWFARAQGSNAFSREWLTKVFKVPDGVAVRGWDKASSEPSQVERHPDFTASCKIIKSLNGRYTIVGDYIPDNSYKDDNEVTIYGKFRKRAGSRDTIIKDQALADGDSCRVVLPVDPGSAGKVQPYDSKVVTKNGFKDLKDIKEGSLIMNPDGTQQKVLKVFPHKDWQFYKVTFNDGSDCEVGAEHLWVSWRSDFKTTHGKNKPRDPYSLWSHNAEVISTEGLQGWLDSGYSPLIPVTKPIQHAGAFSKNAVDPYILGAILGDGCITCSGANFLRFSGIDEQITEYFRAEGYSLGTYKVKDHYFRRNSKGLDLYKDLNNLGLIGADSSSKFIPQPYLVSSINVREGLLQGLMDTDGYVSCDGKLEYCTVSKKLSEGFVRLVQSLGGWCTVSEKHREGWQVAYIHYVRLPNEIKPFRLERKLERVTTDKRRLTRRVVSIEPSRVADGACILVNNPNHLYLTDNYIVTHNTEFEAAAAGLASVGILVSKDPMPHTTGKMNRFLPFASACENGLVDICEESFGNRETVEAFYKELESFSGERSTRQRKDDWPDCIASAFNYVRKSVVVPAFKLGASKVNTNVTDIIAEINK